LLYVAAAFLFLLFLTPQKQIRQVDIPQYFAVGHIVRDGKIARLYDHDSYRDYVALAGKDSLYYNRPAVHALVLLPFAYMSYDSFKLTVRIGSYALFAQALWLIPRWFPLRHSRALLLAYQPFLVAVALGQDAILLTLIVAYGLHLLFKGQDLQGGACIALVAASKPHIIWAIPIALAAQREWRALAGFLTVAATLLLTSFALVGPRGAAQFIALLQAPTTDIKPELMGNIRGIFIHFGPVVAIALSVIAAASFAVCVWMRPLKVALAAAIFAGPLFSPHAYLHDYSLAAISALSPYAPAAYGVLIPWQMFWPEKTISAIPFALTGVAFMFVLAFWPEFKKARSLLLHSVDAHRARCDVAARH
jgi:hypothetical protein